MELERTGREHHLATNIANHPLKDDDEEIEDDEEDGDEDKEGQLGTASAWLRERSAHCSLPDENTPLATSTANHPLRFDL